MNDEAKIALEYIKSATSIPVAYLHITHHSQPETDPLDVEFYWDEKGFGSIAKVNLREEYLEVFNDDPSRYADQMPGVVASLRGLADEIEAIHAKTVSGGS